MSSVESYDGLCGVIYRFSTSERQIRCKYEFDHIGKHSWDGNCQAELRIFGGITKAELIARGYIKE